MCMLSSLIDSLFGYDTKDQEVTSVAECFELQCNQVFVGMVTMQYQAQTDMVSLTDIYFLMKRLCDLMLLFD